MNQNLTVESIGNAFRSALSKGFIREEDTLVMFHDLSFLEGRIQHLNSVFLHKRFMPLPLKPTR